MKSCKQKLPHHINRQAKDLPEAVGLLISTIATKVKDCRNESDELSKACAAAMEPEIKKALAAHAIYDRIVATAMVAAKTQAEAEMRQLGLNEWADCLHNDDYSAMAF